MVTDHQCSVHRCRDKPNAGPRASTTCSTAQSSHDFATAGSITTRQECSGGCSGNTLEAAAAAEAEAVAAAAEATAAPAAAEAEADAPEAEAAADAEADAEAVELQVKTEGSHRGIV